MNPGLAPVVPLVKLEPSLTDVREYVPAQFTNALSLADPDSLPLDLCPVWEERSGIILRYVQQ